MNCQGDRPERTTTNGAAASRATLAFGLTDTVTGRASLPSFGSYGHRGAHCAARHRLAVTEFIGQD